MLFLLYALRQSKVQIAINLLLAPIYALLSVLLPCSIVLFALQQFLSNLPNTHGFMLMVFIFGLVIYLILIYPLVLICLLLLQHFKRFNLLNILITALIANVLLGVAIDANNIVSALLSLAIFTIPTIGFFMFLTWRTHQKNSGFDYVA